MTEADVLSHQVREFAVGWYRDTQGIDQTEFGGISVGSTLSSLIWQATGSILRCSLRFDESLRLGATPTLWRDATPLERRVAHNYGVVSSLQANWSLVPQLDELVISQQMLNVPFSAKVVQKIQAAFHSHLAFPKHLWIADWLTHHVSRADPLGTVLYRKSFHRSAIPHTNSAARSQAESYFPKDLDLLFNNQRLIEFLAREEFEWPNFAVTALCGYVQDTYRSVRELLVEASAQILSMLEFYSPSTVFLPGDTIETWNLWYQFCQLLHIKTVMYMDGYAVIPFLPLLKDSRNSSWLVKEIAAYGSAQADMYQKNDYPRSQIEVVRPPFIMHQQKLRYRPAEFDAIVLTWTHLNINPYSDSHSPATTLASVLHTLRKCGKKKIAVKVRYPGELPYVREILKNVGSDAVVLEGYLWQHLERSNLFIGGISTALAEVSAKKKRYVVFEPEENGYTDLQIGRATVISRKTIARDTCELEVLIRSGESSWIGDPESNLLR